MWGDWAGDPVGPEDWSTKLTKGQRNVRSNKAGWQSPCQRKMSPADALPMLLAWNETYCYPPLDEAEVKQIVESIANKEKSKPSLSDTIDPKLAAEQLVAAREIVTGLLEQAAVDTAEAHQDGTYRQGGR